jgi:hypothetical protein
MARTRTIGIVSATVSGGLSWYRMSGDARSLGYTEFRLGGHSVLFSDEKHVAFALEPANAFGFNAGIDVDLVIGPRAAVVAGYRYLAAESTDATVRPTGITNPGEVLFSTTLDEIARHLSVRTAQVRPSGSRVIVGLLVRL